MHYVAVSPVSQDKTEFRFEVHNEYSDLSKWQKRLVISDTSVT